MTTSASDPNRSDPGHPGPGAPGSAATESDGRRDDGARDKPLDTATVTPGPSGDPATPTQTASPTALRFPRTRAYLARHEFLASVLKVMSGTGVAQLVAMLAILYVTHHVSPTQWGVYTAVASASGFIVPIATWRYEMAIVLPRDDREARSLFNLATKINIGMSALSTLAMIPLGGYLADLLSAPPGTHWWMLAVGPFILTYAQYNIVNFWANRRKRFGTIGTNAVWKQFVTAAARLASASLGFGAGGQVASAVLGSVAGLSNFQRRLGSDLTDIKPSGISTRALMRKYRKMPLLTGPNSLVDAIRLQGIPWSLGIYFNAATMGLFGMAWALMQVPASVINQAMSQVFYQKLSVTDAGRMFPIVRKAMLRSALIAVVPFVALYFLVPPVLPMLLGAKYAPAAPIAVALIPWLYLNFITSPVSNLFIVTRNNGLALAFATVYMIVPLVYLNRRHVEIVDSVTGMSNIMAGLLAFYVVLALVVAKVHDKRHGGLDAQASAAENAEQTDAVGNEQL